MYSFDLPQSEESPLSELQEEDPEEFKRLIARLVVGAILLFAAVLLIIA